MIKKIAICDDSALARRQTAGYFEQLQKELPFELCPSYFSSGEEVLSGLAKDTDLLLLDIAMDGMNGIECAKALRARESKFPIVFITSMTEYAIAGYAVHAFGFLPKPVTYSDFAAIIKEALAASEIKPKKILIKTAEGVSTIDPQELIYAEVYQHETSFHLLTSRIQGNVQLGSIEPLLPAEGFFRCHKSYLVSLEQIASIGRDTLTMRDGSSIPLSKHRRKAFLDAYSRFAGVRFE